MNTTHNMINGFYEGETIDDCYVITSIVIGTTANGSQYLRGTLTDITGSVQFICWDYHGSIMVADNGKIVKVSGEVTAYRDNLQVRCSAICIVAADTIPVDDYKVIVPHAPIDAAKSGDYIWNTANSIEDPTIRNIVLCVLDANWHKFTTIPAAVGIHHACIHGLLMHTCDMLRAAEQIVTVYNGRINRDLLLAGTILHDIGKVYEFEISPTGLAAGYTLAGNATGHSIIGVDMIDAIAKEQGYEGEKVDLIKNMIASHHGNPEYGAAAKGITVEAEVLHALDMIDSRVQIYNETFNSTPYGEFSPFIRALDKKVYNHVSYGKTA